MRKGANSPRLNSKLGLHSWLFYGTMDRLKERKIASLLNKSNATNIFNGAEELEDLIHDYFINDDVEEASDEDSSDEKDEEQTESEILEGEEDENRPLLNVQFGSGGISTSTNNDAGQENGDDPMLQRIREFACKCKQIRTAAEAGVDIDQRRGCVSQFSDEQILEIQLSVAEMTDEELDFTVMGVLSANMRTGPTTECSKKKVQKERQKTRMTYTAFSMLVCRKTFLFLYGIGKKKLSNIMTHFKAEGLQPRPGRKGKQYNSRALKLEDTQRVYRFIKNYAEDHAVHLPGRVPGFKREIMLLPSAVSKADIHRLYKDSCNAAGARDVALSTFRKLWKTLLPFVVVARPMTDLCALCQQNNTLIFHSANLSDEEKLDLLFTQQQHLSRVEEERQLYKHMTNSCKEVVAREGLNGLGVNQPCSKDIEMHYSFDFAQQVHIPSSAAQVGPLYFLTPRKCGIFGVCCEGYPQQVNYLIDEASSGSKGSNAVISYLLHFFSQYGMGETTTHLHCDNCSGQNKNRYVLWYFAWRTMMGLHADVTLNFMPPGHTKFAPDWCFGLLKRKFRRSEVSCLADFCHVVRQSTAVAGVNIPQLVASENGETFVPTYDWQVFFRGHFRALQGMKKIGHFRFSSQHPGTVFHRETLADAEEEYRLLMRDDSIQHLQRQPPVKPPPGLSVERRRYLFNQIRQFVREDYQDIVTPNPDI